MGEIIYETVDEIVAMAKSVERKYFSEIDKHDRLGKNTKGMYGHIIEESLYGYDINSNPEADFANLGVELKVTPIKQLKSGLYSAKERLVLNIINYMDEVHLTFETSSFLNKNNTLLLLFYLWEESSDSKDFEILKAHLMEHTADDLEIFKNDWQIIVDKIKAGKAHELSESDTMYLAACTKGANKESTREQPFSDIPAMQRAFSFKNSYMTALVRDLLSDKHYPSLNIAATIKEKSLEEILSDKFSPYYNQTFEQILQALDIVIKKNVKNRFQLLASAILGLRGTKLEDITEFAKANIQIKTIRLKESGMPREAMSFPTFSFTDLIQQEWDTSDLREIFETTKLLFIIFQEHADGSETFSKIKLWNMPSTTIENEIRDVWDETRRVINEGVILTPNGNQVLNNFPKTKFNGVAHVRPHAAKASYEPNNPNADILPDGRWMTKQCFWLNAGYIKKILSE